MRYMLLIIVLTTLCVDCCISPSRSVIQKLNSIESRLDAYSELETSLSELDSLKSYCAKPRSLQARYSLLMAIALDRNYIDTTDIEVILPAVNYYKKRGSLLNKMRSFFYLGRIYSNRNELDKAILCYQKALEDSSLVTDNHCKELINSALSDVFSRNHCYVQEIEYAKAALRYSIQCKDSIGTWAITGHLATSLGNLDLWEESEDTYLRFFSMPVIDSSVYIQRKLFYAKSLLRQPVPDPQKCVEIIEEAADYYKGSLSVESICLYAYAQELLGNTKDADALLAFVSNNGDQKETIDLWTYRIRRHQGKYNEAVTALENSVVYQDTVVLQMLRQSLILAQSDYFRTEAESAKKDVEIKKQRSVLIVFVSLFIILVIFALFYKKKSSLDRKIMDLSALHQSVQQMLEIQNDANDAALRSLRRQFVSMFKSHYTTLNDLCSAYWSPIRKDRKEQIYEEVKKILGNISGDEEAQTKFADTLNARLDGILDKLKIDLPDHNEKDFNFLAFVIAGFDAKTIATLMNYSVGSVYTKKNRLKSKIDKISSENTKLYKEYLR